MTFLGPSVFSGDLRIKGRLTPTTLDVPAGTLTDASVSASADVSASKLQHQYRLIYAQPAETIIAARQPLGAVYGSTGAIIEFRAGSISACTGNAVATVDLRKNGSSVLADPITLDENSGARTMVSATVSNDAIEAGDFLEVVVTVNAGTGALGTGLLAELIIREKATP